VTLAAPSSAAATPASRVVHWLPSPNRSVVERALERWEAAFAELVG
jgi:hypothetical protein